MEFQANCVSVLLQGGWVFTQGPQVRPRPREPDWRQTGSSLRLAWQQKSRTGRFPKPRFSAKKVENSTAAGSVLVTFLLNG